MLIFYPNLAAEASSTPSADFSRLINFGERVSAGSAASAAELLRMGRSDGDGARPGWPEAKSAPLTTIPCPITSPSPLAPPVTTPTLPCSENVASGGSPCAPPPPTTGGSEGGTAVGTG